MSKQWYKLVFQKNDENYLESCRNIQSQFHEIWVLSGSPNEMALFSREEPSKIEVFYFSPACNQDAKKFLNSISALPCDKPDYVGLGLLEGDQASRVSMFGEKARIEIPASRHRLGK